MARKKEKKSNYEYKLILKNRAVFPIGYDIENYKDVKIYKGHVKKNKVFVKRDKRIDVFNMYNFEMNKQKKTIRSELNKINEINIKKGIINDFIVDENYVYVLIKNKDINLCLEDYLLSKYHQKEGIKKLRRSLKSFFDISLKRKNIPLVLPLISAEKILENYLGDSKKNSLYGAMISFNHNLKNKEVIYDINSIGGERYIILDHLKEAEFKMGIGEVILEDQYPCPTDKNMLWPIEFNFSSGTLTSFGEREPTKIESLDMKIENNKIFLYKNQKKTNERKRYKIRNHKINHMCDREKPTIFRDDINRRGVCVFYSSEKPENEKGIFKSAILDYYYLEDDYRKKQRRDSRRKKKK